MKGLALICTIAIMALLWAVLAWSQTPLVCGPYKKFTDVLAEKHGEGLLARGSSTRGGIMEIWVNATSRTFTVIHASSPALACFLDQGADFETARFKPGRKT